MEIESKIKNILQDNLPDKLEFTGEFGSEIGLFIPFLRFINKFNCLENRKIITYPGMEIFYKASQLPLPEIKNDKREHLKNEKLIPWLPIWYIHSYNNKAKSIFHDFPNYRNYFDQIHLDLSIFFKEDRPLLIIFNKLVKEWNDYPINFFGAEDLSQIFNATKNKYNIIYCQHDLMAIDKSQYSLDHNESFSNKLEKLELITKRINNERSRIIELLNEQSPHNIITFQSIYENSKIKNKFSYNELQCKLISLSNDFISVQGGGSLLLAAFGDCNLHILHKRGKEYPDSYFGGYYNFIAPKPPNIFVYKENEELIKNIIKVYN